MRTVVAAVALLLAAEAALRVSRLGLSPAALGRWAERPRWEAIRTIDARGPWPVRGGHARWALQAGSPAVDYRTDDDGFRVAEAPRQRGGARCAVAVFGDSNAFGYGVAAEAAFPAQLEDVLGAPDVAVTNAGIAGSGIAQQRRWIEELVARRAPDVVVLAVSPWSLRLDVPAGGPAGRTVGERLWDAVNRSTGRLAEWSAVVDRARRRIFHLLAGPIGWPPASVVAQELEPLLEPRPVFARRFAGAAAEIGAVADRLHGGGTELVLVLVPLDVQVSVERNALYRAERLPYPAYGFLERDYTRDGRYAAALGELATALGVRLVDVTRRLASAAEDSYLEDDYHVSERGHRRIAEEIAPAVRTACRRTVTASGPGMRDRLRETHG